MIYASVVFPTPVGGVPFFTDFLAYLRSLPHARGGGSDFRRGPSDACASSPRPWGGFYILRIASAH